MKLLIAVPSRNRYRENQIVRNTFSWLKYSKFDFMVFVEPAEYEKYCQAIGSENVTSIEKDNIGIGGSKCFMQKWATKHGYDLILKCDDDIWNWRDFKNGWYPFYKKTSGIPMEERKKACAEFVFDRAMEDCIQLFEQRKDVGAISYYYGQSMFHKPGTKWTTFNTELATVYMIRTELLAPERQAEIHQFEEFYSWYNLRKLGYFAPRYGLAGIHVDGDYGTNAGGFQDFDRRKMTIKSIALLSKIYPGELFVHKSTGKGGFFMNYNWHKIALCRNVPVPDELK